MKLENDLIGALRALDTPTVCNALEIVAPERRGFGFSTSHLRCARPELPPIVGYACTAVFRCVRPGSKDAVEQKRYEGQYFDYVAGTAGPKIAVFQDGDGVRARSSAIFGEIMSWMHKALGADGLVTDGAVRDMSMMAEGFQAIYGAVAPSHIWFHMTEFDCEVNIAGMVVNSGDLIHADSHGAVIIPPEYAAGVVEAAKGIAVREEKIIGLCAGDDFTVDALKKIWGGE
jgi:regulator of RNase E activity RraA